MVEALVFALDEFVNTSVRPDWLAERDTKDFYEKHCEGHRQKQMHSPIGTESVRHPRVLVVPPNIHFVESALVSYKLRSEPNEYFVSIGFLDGDE